MAPLSEEDPSKPLLDGLEGICVLTEDEDSRYGARRLNCMPPKLEVLEGFESGSTCSLQTNLQTVFNTMNLYIGVGLLSLGYAVKLGGWMTLGVLALLGLILSYSAKLICRSFDRVPVGIVPSYPNLGATVYGLKGQWAVMVIAGAEFFGALCLCLIIFWQSVSMLLPVSTQCLGYICLPPSDAAIVGSTFVILPVVLIRTFSRLTSISISGVVTSLLLTLVVVTAYLLDPQHKDVSDPSSSIHQAVNWPHLPVATGIMVVSLSGHAGLPSLRRSMMNPQQFERCVNIAFFCMFLMYATMGGFAYMYFGQATQVLITGNLNDSSSITGFILLRIGTFKLTINEIVTALVAMSAFTTIPALVYVLAELLVDLLRGNNAGHVPGIGDLIMRIVVLGFGYLVAYMAYNILDSVESIVGGACSVSISLILPSFFYFKLYKQDLAICNKGVVLAMGIFGIICAVGVTTINILILTNRIEV